MASELPEECCAKCRFGELMREEPFLQDSEFRCRRYPPSVFIGAVGESDVDEVADNATSSGYFYAPYVTGDNWCGEFQPRKAEPTSPA